MLFKCMCLLLIEEKNVTLSLAKRIFNIVSDMRDARLLELQQNLMERKHRGNSVTYTFTMIFRP